MGKRRGRKQKPPQESSVELSFTTCHSQKSDTPEQEISCSNVQPESICDKDRSDQGPKYSTPDDLDALPTSINCDISPIRSSPQGLTSGSILLSPSQLVPLQTSTPLKSNNCVIYRVDPDRFQHFEESPKSLISPKNHISLVKKETPQLECLTPVRSSQPNRSVDGITKSPSMDSPVFIRLCDLDETKSSEDDDNNRYTLRPRNLFSKGVSIQRYNPYNNDSEAEDDDDDDVLYFLDEDDSRSMRRKSSYSGCRGPRADAKALSLVTNCPISVKWLVDNFEYHPGKSLPRGFVYDQYVLLCDENGLEPVNAASFGKLIRSVFPGLKTRRLGTRGNSKYHYNGVYLKTKSPLRSILNLIRTQQGLTYDNNGRRGRRVRKCTEIESSKDIMGLVEGEEFIDCSPDEYLGRRPELERPFAELTVDFSTLPASLDPSAIALFETLYGIHCQALLTAFEKFDLRGVFDEWKRFWRIKLLEPVPEGMVDYKQSMSKVTLFKVCSLEATQDFIMSMDLSTYQFVIDILYPCPSRGMPITMVHGIRTFIKDLEFVFLKIMDGYPKKMAQIKLRCLRTYISMWNDYSRLNRMLKCAAHTMRSEDNINVMKSELYRALDFNELENEAVLHLKPSANSLITQLMLDFRNNLDSPINCSVKGWVNWVEEVVQKMTEESQRQVSEGEVSKCLNPFSFWRTASDKIMGAMVKGNAVSFGIVKGFLIWCDFLVRHVCKIHVSRAEGFMLPIFYYECNLEKANEESKFFDMPATVSKSSPTGRPGRLVRPLNLKFEDNGNAYARRTRSGNCVPMTQNHTESDVNNMLINVPASNTNNGLNMEGTNTQYLQDPYSEDVYYIDSALLSDTDLLAFLESTLASVPTNNQYVDTSTVPELNLDELVDN